MSYEEKGTWIYLVTSAGAYAVYLAIVLGRLLSTPVAEVPYISVLLWTTGASIVASIAGRVLVETARPSGSRRSDVRDKEISRFGEHASRWFVVARGGRAVHGDGTVGLLLDRQRPLPRIRPVGDRRIGAEAPRLPARPVPAVMTKPTRITNSIRALRFANGEMTQAQLARCIGVTRQTIIAIEQGRYSPSLEMAFQIAQVFKVALDEVFQYPEGEVEPQ